jgi:glycerol-3-phosphate cytidylyltransferase-like family protein
VYLLVGVSSDEQVKQHKFKCVLDHVERCEAVRHCRWVDEVIPDAPWVIDPTFLAKYNIDYVAHDDEPYLSAGHEDVYAYVKSIGSSATSPACVRAADRYLKANLYQRVARPEFQQVHFWNG